MHDPSSLAGDRQRVRLVGVIHVAEGIRDTWLAKVMARVDRRGDDECWLTTGTISAKGYGRIWLSGRHYTLHRVVYELLVGPIPKGMQIDHLCRVRACSNPAHLEPVTPAENTRRGESFSAQNARKGQCLRGHEFNEENTYLRVDKPGRGCRPCARINWSAGREARESRVAS